MYTLPENKILEISRKRLEESGEMVRQHILKRFKASGNDPVVYIRRQWNSWRIGKVKLSQLSQLGWDNYSGGVGAKAPRYFIHGYVWCNEVEGEIDHSCVHGAGPHRIKVCITKKDNDDREVFEVISALAGPKPK